MRHRPILEILLGLALAAASTPAWAIPTLSIDLDTATPGVQSTRSVLLGDTVEAGVVLTGDGSTGFDTTIFDLSFDAAVIGVAPGGPEAGALAGTAPVGALDVFGGGFVLPGGSLTPQSAAATGSIGGIGLSSLALPFPTVGVGEDVMVALSSFDTLALGQTTLSLGPVVPGDFLLALAGTGVDVELESALLRVRSAEAVPEPDTLLLLFAATLALARRRSLR